LRIFGCPAYAFVNDSKLAPGAMVMHPSPRDIVYGVLVPRKSFKVGCYSNEFAMFSPGKESIVSLTSTGDHHDTGDKVELQVPTQGGVTTSTLPHSSSMVQINEPELSTSSPDKPQVEDMHSIAYDRPRRTIRKSTHYATDYESGLIAYALAVVQEIPESIEPSTILKPFPFLTP